MVIKEFNKKNLQVLKDEINDTDKKILDPVQAMNARNKLNGKQRQEKTEFYFPGRKHTSLNGSEIKRMF